MTFRDLVAWDRPSKYYRYFQSKLRGNTLPESKHCKNSSGKKTFLECIPSYYMWHNSFWFSREANLTEGHLWTTAWHLLSFFNFPRNDSEVRIQSYFCPCQSIWQLSFLHPLADHWNTYDNLAYKRIGQQFYYTRCHFHIPIQKPVNQCTLFTHWLFHGDLEKPVVKWNYCALPTVCLAFTCEIN